MKTPKEDPDAKADRKRERRISMMEQRRSAEEAALGMTMDTNRVYGFGSFGGGRRGLVSVPNRPGAGGNLGPNLSPIITNKTKTFTK